MTGLTFVVLEIYREEFQEQLPGTTKLSRAEVGGRAQARRGVRPRG